jgi:tRNA1Val (adenine37-N6)-methyltransferase
MGKGFQFKQFYISQDRCAMKVSETACVFGAFTPLTGKEKYILDVGTGTGVLALMLAQRSSASIKAIDIDEDAVEEARQNINSTQFKNRISVEKGDFLSWDNQQHFDLIICNPPFFENQLASDNEKKRKAWHSSHISLKSLISKASMCLSPQGRIALLLPEQRVEETISIGRNLCLTPYFRFSLQHNKNHKVKYSLLGLTTQVACPMHERKLVLRNSIKQYTDIVYQHLQPFYASL